MMMRLSDLAMRDRSQYLQEESQRLIRGGLVVGGTKMVGDLVGLMRNENEKKEVGEGVDDDFVVITYAVRVHHL